MLTTYSSISHSDTICFSSSPHGKMQRVVLSARNYRYATSPRRCRAPGHSAWQTTTVYATAVTQHARQPPKHAHLHMVLITRRCRALSRSEAQRARMAALETQATASYSQTATTNAKVPLSLHLCMRLRSSRISTVQHRSVLSSVGTKANAACRDTSYMPSWGHPHAQLGKQTPSHVHCQGA